MPAPSIPQGPGPLVRPRGALDLPAGVGQRDRDARPADGHLPALGNDVPVEHRARIPGVLALRRRIPSGGPRGGFRDHPVDGVRDRVGVLARVEVDIRVADLGDQEPAPVLPVRLVLGRGTVHHDLADGREVPRARVARVGDVPVAEDPVAIAREVGGDLLGHRHVPVGGDGECGPHLGDDDGIVGCTGGGRDQRSGQGPEQSDGGEQDQQDPPADRQCPAAHGTNLLAPGRRVAPTGRWARPPRGQAVSPGVEPAIVATDGRARVSPRVGSLVSNPQVGVPSTGLALLKGARP